ncbi:hypothetical protein QOZ99_000671 [Angulomicrobium amanitiforme]|uniref:Uncharacterized protein n=1 Tax=Ancylobacter amanitiformis TaxID=217069 RepID=A0ABU0LMA6_9HYPH|nr:hypothetical protein [Ancylobacter amanitiformis]
MALDMMFLARPLFTSPRGAEVGAQRRVRGPALAALSRRCPSPRPSPRRGEGAGRVVVIGRPLLVTMQEAAR